MSASPVRETWSSGVIFILASVGSAVGLANIWRFPYAAGTNGGGAFVMIYLISIFLITVPIYMSELLIGRRGRKSPIASIVSIAKEMKVTPAWCLIGWNGIILAVLVLSFYSVIAGWAPAYVVKIARGEFSDAMPDVVQEIFTGHLSNAAVLITWHTIFLLTSLSIVALGIRRGVEKAFKLFTPLIFLILISMIVFAIFTGGFMDGVRFLFTVDFSKITGPVILNAVGQAFLTVGAGACAIAIYGAYLPAHISIPRSSLIIVGLDTVVALTAGLAVFPIVFMNGLEPSAGPGLVFLTLPLAFSQITGGTFLGILFMLLLVVAAMTSVIAIVESIVFYAMEKTGLRRSICTMSIGVLIWLLGLATVFSFNIWEDFYPLGFISYFDGMTVFQVIELITINILLPAGGLFIALFVGWKMTAEAAREELMLADGFVFRAWRASLRYLIPPVILFVMFASF